MSVDFVSVIVPAYNAEHTVARCVSALRSQDFSTPYEILVIDDGSTDKTAEAAQSAGAIVLETNRARPAGARNAGIRAARGSIICCTDADCVPNPDWLAQITAPFADESIAACKGTYTTRQRELVARFVQLEYEDKYDLLRRQQLIDFIDTYSAAYRRDVLLGNGGFDERFDYLEDQELSFRLAARGYRMVFQEDAVVEHLHSSTLLAYMRKKAIIGYWKAQVVRRFPSHAAKDSHTPQVMKVQMLLATLLLAALAAGITGMLLSASLWGGRAALALIPAGALAILFLITTFPFARKAWPKDHQVAVVSPVLLFSRAVALAGGYGWGILVPRQGVYGDATISGLNYFAKRLVDLLGGAIGMIFTLILWPLIALLIKLDSRGPVLFTQERIGQGGRPFNMIKFRTMHEGAAEQWPELVTNLGLSEPVLKLSDDPRLTGIGRFLRRWSLDELPQFWNVLKGEMSLVGPRPEEPRVVSYYSDWHRRRLSVKPGMTGLMQINGRADLDLDERVKLDLEYIETYTLSRDLAILLRTLPQILRGDGAR